MLGIFRLAVETQRPEVIEVALDCIQKLIAFRFLQVLRGGCWGRAGARCACTLAWVGL